MSYPKVSIVVPCWNVDKYLNTCIESLVNQTLRDIEIILVDDASPDSVPVLCNQWAQKDSRIKVIHKLKNEGLGMACNTGIDAATGEYIAFCDSDDWVDTEMYEIMYNAAIEYKAQAVYTGLKRVNLQGQLIGQLPHKKELTIYQSNNEIAKFVRDIICSAPESPVERTIQMSAKVVLYKKDIIETFNLRFYSEREILSEDLHFNLAFLSHCTSAIVLPNRFYNYRTTDCSISRKIDSKRIYKIAKLYQFTIEEIQKLGYNNDLYQRIQRMIIGYTRDYIRTIVRADISYSQKKGIINETLSHPMWNTIWKEYPIRSMPLQYKIITILMIRKSFFLLSLLLNIK